MSLTQAVKDFFIGKINSKINEDIRAIEQTIDKEQMEQQAFHTFVLANELEELFDIITLQNRIEELENEKQTLEDDLFAKSRRKGISLSSYAWRRSLEEDIRRKANSELLENLLNVNYPEEQARIAELEALREDVEGVILLATTPTRLRENLTSLLEQYGAQLQGIEKIVEVSNE